MPQVSEYQKAISTESKGFERFAASLFIIALSFTHALALGDYLRLWVVLFLVCTITILFKLIYAPYIRYPRPKPEDAILITFLLYLAVNGALLPNPRTLPYLLAYIFVFFVFFFISKLIVSRLGIRRAMAANFFGVLLVVSFVLTDFFTFNFLGFDVQQLLPRRGRGITAIALGREGFRRSYGFAGEPGVLVLYLNTMGIIALYYAYRAFSLLLFLVFLLSFVLAWLTTFSAGGLGAFIIATSTALIMYSLLRQINMRSLLNFMILGSLAAASIFFVLLPLVFPGFGAGIFQAMISKLTFSDASVGSGRIERWGVALQMIIENPVFGLGLGYAADQGITLVNWYLLLWLDTGFVAVFLIALFLAISAWRCMTLTHGGFVFALAVIAGSVQMAAISTFFNPFLWVAIVFMRVSLTEEAKR